MSTLSVREKDGVLVVDSRLIAQGLGIEHESFLKTINRYKTQTEQGFGILRFEVGEIKGRGQPPKFVYLTEEQSTFLMTLSRNTERVVNCKLELVKAFTEAKKIIKQVIPAQTQEIERLRLENQNLNLQLKVAEAQQKLLATSSALSIINPGLPALVLGRPDAVITKKEVIEKTILVNSKGRAIATYEGLSKTKVARRFGMKRAYELVEWLQSIGKEDVLKPGLTATACQYIPFSEIKELENLWASRQGSRQFLIGE